MAATTFVFASVLFAAVALASGAYSGRTLLQAGAPAPAPGEDGKVFDWGRPCTLVGNSSEVEITGPNNALCTSCGSGATATPEPTCIFKALTCAVGETLNIAYHSSVHHLFIGATACDFATEVCANATASDISPMTPCAYPCTTPGSYFISDKAGKGGADDGEYCTDFGATLPLTITTSS